MSVSIRALTFSVVLSRSIRTNAFGRETDAVEVHKHLRVVKLPMLTFCSCSVLEYSSIHVEYNNIHVTHMYTNFLTYLARKKSELYRLDLLKKKVLGVIVRMVMA